MGEEGKAARPRFVDGLRHFVSGKDARKVFLREIRRKGNEIRRRVPAQSRKERGEIPYFLKALDGKGERAGELPELLASPLAAKPGARQLHIVQIFIEPRMHGADISQIVLALLQNETAQAIASQEMAVALFIQAKASGAILRSPHPLGKLLAQWAFCMSIFLFGIGVNVDFPSLAASVPASARLAREGREDGGVDGVHG